MTRAKSSTPAAPSPKPAPVVRKTTKRRRTPSLTTPRAAAAVADLTPAVVTTPASPVAAPTGTTSATAPPTTAPVPLTTTGLTPVVTTPPPVTTPVVTTPATPPSPPNALTSPPEVVIPSPPGGFKAPVMHDFMGFHPSTRQLTAATTAIADLLGIGDLAALVGPLAPPAGAVAAALRLGMEWRQVRDETNAWDAYVRAQDAMAWKAALQLVDELKPLFLLAVSKDPSLASQYAGLTELFGAPKVAATKAAATKARNARTKAAAVANAPAPVTEAPASPAAPTKTVTVSV